MITKDTAQKIVDVRRRIEHCDRALEALKDGNARLHIVGKNQSSIIMIDFDNPVALDSIGIQHELFMGQLADLTNQAVLEAAG